LVPQKERGSGEEKTKSLGGEDALTVGDWKRLLEKREKKQQQWSFPETEAGKKVDLLKWRK